MIACWCSTWSWKRLPDSSGWSGRLWGCKPPSSCIPWETLLSLRTKREQAGFTHCPEWEKAALRRMDSIRSQHMTTKGVEKKVKFISIALTVSHLSERQSLNCSRLFYFIFFFFMVKNNTKSIILLCAPVLCSQEGSTIFENRYSCKNIPPLWTELWDSLHNSYKEQRKHERIVTSNRKKKEGDGPLCVAQPENCTAQVNKKTHVKLMGKAHSGTMTDIAQQWKTIKMSLKPTSEK